MRQSDYSNILTQTAASWFLAGGVLTSECVAAYQPKGALSLAASYVNLNNPGTNDAAPGTAPTFATATGWTFDGSSQYLVNNLSASQKPVSYIIRVKTTNTTGYRTLIGNVAGTGSLSIDLTAATNVPRFLKQDIVLIGSGTSGFAASVDTVIAVTYSNIGVWTHYLNGGLNGTGTNDQTLTSQLMAIGQQSTGQKYPGIISALAIYNITLDSTQVGLISTAMAAL